MSSNAANNADAASQTHLGIAALLAMPRCQQLAGRMQAGQEAFQYLDAPQLLKHALGLATHLGEHFTLHYIYCDWAGAESAAHQAAIERFASGVDEHLGFTAVSYQQLYARLCEAAVPAHSGYLRYLDSRYFR